MAAPPRLVGAIVAFTGHHVIAGNVQEDEAMVSSIGKISQQPSIRCSSNGSVGAWMTVSVTSMSRSPAWVSAKETTGFSR